MKKLTNKKGFTLIEMLVVIAIIAVLVAIIIPVVTNSTTKAAAAANAANMRSFKSEITTLFLQEQGTTTKNIEVSSAGAVSFPDATNVKYPAMKAISGFSEVADTDAAKATTPTSDSNWGITYENNQFIVTYCGHNIDWYATVAETGAAPAANNG